VTGLHDDLDLHDPELAHAADVLSRSLVRFHPSFRFEERLAARLRLAGFGPMTARVPLAVGLATPAPPLHVAGRVPRPVLVGGAIASGVSIAGAAVVAWRRLRRDA
jgi:hypothetical protein